MFALWWVSSEILMTGHGDFLPASFRERHFAMLLMALNLSLFAYITSAMSVRQTRMRCLQPFSA